MKNSINVIILVNRFLVFGAALLFIFEYTSKYMVFFQLFLTLILGAFHIITALFFLRFWNNFSLNIKIGLGSYLVILLLYFLISRYSVFNHITNFIHPITIPILLTLLFTIIIEYLHILTNDKILNS